MIGPDSSLRRIPASVNRKQAIFLDGIRHSIDIMELAYSRLSRSLTEIAFNNPTSSDLSEWTTHVFLDAWAMVEAVHKFRGLYENYPGVVHKKPSERLQPTLAEVIEPFTKIRNTAAHPLGTADKIVSKGGAAFGILTWLTGKAVDPISLWRCTLIPGSLQSEVKATWEKIPSIIDWPTDQICLSIAGDSANLSLVRPHIAIRVKHLEKQIEDQFNNVPGLRDSFSLNDALMRQLYPISPDKPYWKSDSEESE